VQQFDNSDAEDLDVLDQTALIERALENDAEILTTAAVAADAGYPTLVIDEPAANATFFIDPTPAMPVINCRARITGLSPDPTPQTLFDWQITITETPQPGTCQSAKVQCVQSEEGHIIGGRWTPVLDFFQGGEAVIRVGASVEGQTVQNTVGVRIRGTNPGAAAITAACGAGSDADRIACHESRRRQFANGLPYLGPGGDVGVMQLCNPAATCRQRWSWLENVIRGMNLLEQKRVDASTYLNKHAPGGNFPNDLGLSNAEVLQREAIQRFNGGSYWRWDGDKNHWVAHPPTAPNPNYVRDVLACS
jgi:hypothetical protein